MNSAFEFVDSGPIRDVSLGSKAGADDQIFGFSSSAIGCFDVPTSFLSVELSIDNNTLKSGLALDVENPITGVEVVSQVVIVGVVVRPIVSSTLSALNLSNI